MLKSSTATTVLLAALALVATGESEREFGYTAKHGRVPPTDWGSLPDSELCRTGDMQSPIAIGTERTVPGNALAAPVIDYGSAKLDVHNNGHTVQADVREGAGRIDIDGTTFDLLQFHIHYPSEHMIDGDLHLAEIHLVHEDAAGNLAVIASLLRPGDRNRGLNPFFRAAGRVPEEGDRHEVEDFDLDRLVPEGEPGYYHYIGSLTTPPCSEGVSWWVFDQLREAGGGQLDDIRSALPPGENPEGNRRPVQDLHRRAVSHVEG